MDRDQVFMKDENNKSSSKNVLFEDEERSVRFVDTNKEQILKSSNLNEIENCFYQGDLVAERMASVRKSIYHIRKNWNKFEQMMNTLEQYMKDEAQKDGGLSPIVCTIFQRRRNWCDIETDKRPYSSLKDEFNIVNSYTTNEGFSEIFKVANSIFRRDSSINYDSMILNAVFLIELFNLDLFNYVHKFPEFQNFEGMVYRGMAVPAENFKIFETLLDQPINKRYISIPLGLWSSTLGINVSLNFVKDLLKKDQKKVPLLMKINVLNLNPDHLKYYHKKFPESVVSTICAVHVEHLSNFPEEREVILRGGFYQALRYYSETIDGIAFKVIDLVMLNTNRDHLSNPISLGERDGEARALFGNMVGVTRNKFIIQYCEKHDLFEDKKAYQEALQNNENKLKELMK